MGTLTYGGVFIVLAILSRILELASKPALESDQAQNIQGRKQCHPGRGEAIASKPLFTTGPGTPSTSRLEECYTLLLVYKRWGNRKALPKVVYSIVI